MTDQQTLPPVFVISLPSSSQRRADMAARLDSLGLPWRFFDGVDGAKLSADGYPDYDRTRRLLFFGKDLTPGEMGCLLAHRAVYRHMVDNNIGAAVVLEDDVMPAPDFAAVIAELLAIGVRWDVIRFIGKDKVYRNSRDVIALDGSHTLIRPFGTPGGTYGYMLTQDAAKKLLTHMQSNWLPVDTLHGFVWKTGLEVFAVNPSPVMHDDEIKSTIGDARFDKTVQLQGWQKAIYPLTRFYFKMAHVLYTRLSSQSSRARDRAVLRGKGA